MARKKPKGCLLHPDPMMIAAIVAAIKRLYQKEDQEKQLKAVESFLGYKKTTWETSRGFCVFLDSRVKRWPDWPYGVFWVIGELLLHQMKQTEVSDPVEMLAVLSKAKELCKYITLRVKSMPLPLAKLFRSGTWVEELPCSS